MLQYLKKLVPERAKHLLFRVPREHWRRFRNLGAASYFFLESWSAEMERSVATLPPLDRSGDPVDLWFLTGRRFWYQTAYCAWTFGKHASRPVNLNLVDDGTLEAKHVNALRRLFESVEVIDHATSREQLLALLPSEHFPTLNLRWNDYVHLRKLINVHLGQTGPRLVLDSDMLFFARPTLLLDWLDIPGSRLPIYMTDCVESYGYSQTLLQELAGAPLPDKLNVGICGLNSEQIDWEQLEAWSARLLAQEGTSYFLEQALVAILVARTSGVQVPASDYVTLPSKHQVERGIGVLQHYVAASKSDYFQSAWRIARARCGT